MPDRLTDALLMRVGELNGVTMLDEGELLSLFPPKAGVDRRSAEDMLFYLAERKFVEVEYAAEGTYCIRPLPEGRLYLERAAEKRKEGRRSALRCALFSALGGAAGGIAGGLLLLLASC